MAKKYPKKKASKKTPSKQRPRLGSGMAEGAARTLEGRRGQLRRQEEEAMGGTRRR